VVKRAIIIRVSYMGETLAEIKPTVKQVRQGQQNNIHQWPRGQRLIHRMQSRVHVYQTGWNSNGGSGKANGSPGVANGSLLAEQPQLAQ
jgi:hypothetical protein